jgi:hypothetical protein
LVGRKSGQKSSSGVHVEFTDIVLPKARFPIGGKQPALFVHIPCAEAAEKEHRSRIKRMRIEVVLRGRSLEELLRGGRNFVGARCCLG